MTENGSNIIAPLRAHAVPIGSLTVDPENARLHPEGNVSEIMAALSQFGQHECLKVMPDGRVVIGNGRLEAARRLGWAQIACVTLDDDEAMARARALSDNKVAESAAWDPEVALAQLEALAAKNVAVPGFGEDAMKELEALAEAAREPKDGETDPDDVPEVQNDPITEPGDLWLCGEHRVLCGDCTKAEDVSRCGTQNADAVFADPPYNVGKDYGGRTDDDRDIDSYQEWCASWFGLLPDVLTVITPGPKHCEVWASIKSGYAHCAWLKRNGQGRNPFGGTCKWEPVWLWNYPADYGLDVFEVNTDYSEHIASDGDHPVPKPVQLIEVFMKRFGGGAWLDPFFGSGTTMIACEQLRRRCYGIEIEPRYVDVAVRRWQAFTGQKATTESGKTIEATT